MRWLTRGRSPADLEGCGRAAPDPPGPLRLPGDLEPAWNPRRPEFAFAANSVSLIMPHAEPYFVRVTRAALPELEPEQRAEAEAYIRQEAQHHAQHRRFNDLLVARCPGLGRLERWMAKAYGWVERRRSLRFNLAFAAASETIAYSLARWTERRSGDLFDGAEPVPASLFLWHLAEEVEHKSAAFDVWKAVDGNRRHYVLAGTTSVVLLAAFTWLGTMVMLRHAHRLASPTSHARLVGVGGEPRVHDPARPRGVGPQAPPPEPVRRPDPALDLAAGLRPGHPDDPALVDRAADVSASSGSTPAGPARSAPAARRRRSGRPCRVRSRSAGP